MHEYFALCNQGCGHPRGAAGRWGISTKAAGRYQQVHLLSLFLSANQNQVLLCAMHLQNAAAVMRGV